MVKDALDANGFKIPTEIALEPDVSTNENVSKSDFHNSYNTRQVLSESKKINGGHAKVISKL